MAGEQSSTTQRRVFGALLFVPVIVLFLASPATAQWAFMALALVMAWELASMLAMHPALRFSLLFDIALFALPAPLVTGMETHAGFALWPVFAALAALITAFVWMTGANRLAALFTVCLLLCVFSAREILGFEGGHVILLAIAAIVAACDIAAYFVGRRVGGPRLAPVLSPKKTQSGAIGGLLGAVLVAVLVGRYLSLSTGEAMVAGICIAVLAQSGDLLESALKRHLDVKDSGRLIPGHGGFLDRFDGYLLTLPAIYLYMVMA